MSGADAAGSTAPARDAKPDERHAGAQIVVYLCFTEPADVSEDELRRHLESHKAWLAQLEQSSDLMFAGPMLDENYRYSGSGLLVLRANSMAEAAEIADRDPFHSRGIRRYRLVPWQINEGSLDVRFTLSDGQLCLS